MDTYAEALSWIHSRLKHGINLGLARMEWMLERLGNPEKALNVIHVAGTNGKGSTVTFLRSILNEAGYEVGTFTSPYIEVFNERISINGKPISDEDLVELVRVVKPVAEAIEKEELGSPTEFEVITAMAMYYFANIHPVEFTLLEVGLGGRFDSTNTIDPLMTIITNIGMDHTNILGDTIEKIAYEKAGIIKSEVPVFTGAKQDAALSVIKAEAKKESAELFQLGVNFFVKDYQPVSKGEMFTFEMENIELKGLETSLMGRHQTENAAIALASLLYLKALGRLNISENDIRAGLARADWPGRMEVLHEEPVILLDGAHNTEGLAAFSEAMKKRYGNKKIKLVFAALEDKDLTRMLPILKEIKANLYLTEFDFPRAASAQYLKEIGKFSDVIVADDWRSLIARLLKSLDQDDVLAITGSLYFLSEVKPFIMKSLN